jgi:hypothetical protein
MSTALNKVRAEAAKLRKNSAVRMANIRKNNEKTVVLASGVIGGAVSAAGCAVADSRFKHADKEVATFGEESDVPVCPVVGIAVAVAGVFIAKKNPATGTFLYEGGKAAVNIGIYNYTRAKMDEYYAENPPS